MSPVIVSISRSRRFHDGLRGRVLGDSGVRVISVRGGTLGVGCVGRAVAVARGRDEVRGDGCCGLACSVWNVSDPQADNSAARSAPTTTRHVGAHCRVFRRNGVCS